MPNVLNVRGMGSQLLITYTDGTTVTAYPQTESLWIAPNETGGTTTPVTPGTEPAPGGPIYNPWSGYSISGTWEEHLSYSLGGVDYPLAYGTNLKAPAAGTLHTSGGTGEYACGWIGTAGRRSILYLDTDYPRVNPTLEDGEGVGNLHAIVFQHQSVMGTDGQHYAQGAVLGQSGASADYQDYGGDVHLHVHGLTPSGDRVNLLNFIP